MTKKSKGNNPDKIIVVFDRSTGKTKTIKGKVAEATKGKVVIDLKNKKSTKKWKPQKGFLHHVVIDPKTDETTNYYITAKNSEEEKKFEKSVDGLFLETIEATLNN